MKTHIKIRPPSENLRRKTRDKNNDSLLREFINENITYIESSNLLPFRGQPRLSFDKEKIDILALSIEEHGLRQPLTVIESDQEKGKYEVVSGERRLRALRQLSYMKIPCIIIYDINKAEEIALIENIQRENLHPVELGKAYMRLLESNLGYSQIKMSEKLGVPRTQIVEYIKFAKLSNDVATLLIEKNISKRNILRKISAFKDIKMQKQYISSILQNTEKSLATNKQTLLKISYGSGKVIIDKAKFSECPARALIDFHKHLTEIVKDVVKLLTPESK